MGVMENRRRIIAAQPHLVTASGSSVLVNIAEPKIERMRVTFSPVQTGSGTPSPSNVRPIMGWATIMASIGTMPVDISLGGTYYGGVVDLVSGVMTVTMGFNSFRWGYGYVAETQMSNYTMRAFPLSAKSSNTDSPGNSCCNMAPWTTNVWARNENHYYFSASGNLAVGLPNGSNDETVVTAAYDLATPQTVTLTPQTIAVMRGQQTVTSPAGAVEISYWTH